MCIYITYVNVKYIIYIYMYIYYMQILYICCIYINIYISYIYGNHKTLFPSWLLILLGNHGTKGTNHILHNVSAFAFFWCIFSTNNLSRI